VNYATATVSAKQPRERGLISGNQIKRKKEKMKRSIRQRIRDWLYADEADVPVAIAVDSDDDLRVDHDQAFHFSVIPAAGGKIVKVQYYDRVKDRTHTKLNIITPDEDLATSLAHILQIEALSR
jgi:hypothetical protein